MADYLVTDTELTSVADAIRTKGGTSAALEFPTGFVTAIGNISGGGGGGGTTSVTIYPSAMGGGYTVVYVDADGNTVQTSYYALDPNFTGSATIIAKSGSPLVILEQSPMLDDFSNPTNATTLFSTSITTSGRPSEYIYFFVYIVN